MWNFNFKVLFMSILFLTIPFGKCIVCRDEAGEPVDWFYIYKLPKQSNHQNPLIRTGLAYMFMTSSRPARGWTLSNMSIGDTSSMPGQTLMPMYENPDLLSLIYNDQPPNPAAEAAYSMQHALDWDENYPVVSLENLNLTLNEIRNNEECGHTKGVVLADKKTALWLVHSVPHFPIAPNAQKLQHYNYPLTGSRYGQTFLCMSLDTNTLNDIGVQLQYNEPQVLYSYIPRGLAKRLPNLVNVTKNEFVHEMPWHSVKKFKTLAGAYFMSFAKSRELNMDLYSGLVAPYLRANLLVETWSNGPGVLDSVCNLTYQVQNIESIALPSAGVSFNTHHDHSKWAATRPKHLSYNHIDTDSYWICVGDINRALSQEIRGGGTVCTINMETWSSFVKLVTSIQDCNAHFDDAF